ncbi:hypothetical protein, partial [Marivirga sp.]|uniref:beta strand repeat-containing protein n=1 Tax=Marivirga sp. TaxID=2018662 RepID=UPI002D805F8E
MGNVYAQVTVTPANPEILCEDGSFVVLSDIIVDENGSNAAIGQSTEIQIFQLAAPSGFRFKPSTGTYLTTSSGGNANRQFVNTGLEVQENYVRFYYKLEDTGGEHSFTLRNLEIQYVGSGTVSNIDILRVAETTGLSFYLDANINGDGPGDGVSHGNLSTVLPNAGTASNTNVCIDQTSFDLNTTLSGQDGGGVWTNGAAATVAGGIINPNALGAGVYNFTYTVSAAPCADDTETVTITVDALPITGTPNDPNVCETDNNYDLFLAIDGEDAGGTWSSLDVDANNAISGSSMDATTLTQGNTYDFIYEVSNPTSTCTETVTTSITIAASDNPGTPSNGFACIDNNAFDLFTLLTGEDPAGTWLDDDATGALTDNLVDASALTAGNTYSFTYQFTGTCTVSSTVDLTIEAIPNPGTATNETICDTEPSFDLFTTLSGHNLGGVWTEITAIPSGELSGSTFDASAAGEGVYEFEYIVSNNSCADESVTVQITVEKSPDAGMATNTSICDSQTAFNLNDVISGNDAGTWTETTATVSGELSGNIFNAANAGLGTYEFTYTVSGTECLDDSEVVEIVVVSAPNPGTPTNTTVCENSGLFDLFTTLAGEDSGGTWIDDDATGAVSGNSLNINALTEPNSYNFTYQLNNGVCIESETVTITIDAQPFAGGAEPPLTLCETSAVLINLYDRITGEEIGGNWTNVGGTAGVAFNVDELDIATAPVGTHEFTYSVSNAGENCTTDMESVFITVEASPNAGTGTNLTVCETSNSINLNNRLSGQDGGGTWNDDSGSSALFGGNFFDVSAVTPGDYDFTYTVTGDDCPSDFVTVTITVEESPNAGTATDANICITENNFDLFSTLSDNDLGGTWTNDDSANGFSGSILDATVNTPGTYNFTYTVSATACPDDFQSVAITIIDPEVTAEFESTPIVSNIEFCPQELVLIEFNSNVAGATYSWTKTGDNVGFAATSGTSSNLNFTTRNNTSGSDLVATINVTATVGGCEGPVESFDIILKSQSVINNYFPPFEVCDQTTDFDLTSLDISVDGTVVVDKLDLSFAGDGVDSGNKTFNATTFAPDEVVSIDVTFNNGTDCPTTRSLNLVQVKQNPSITIDTPASAIAQCVSETVNLSATYNDATSSITWTAFNGTGTFSNITFNSNTATATYTPDPTDANNTVTLRATTNDPGAPCNQVFDEIDVEFYELPVATITSTANQICEDDPIALIGNISGAATNGDWIIKAGQGTAIEDSGILSATTDNAGDWTANFTPDGTYFGDIIFEFIASVDAPNTCVDDTEEITVTIFERPTATIPIDFNSCGDAAFDLDATLDGSAISGEWSVITNGSDSRLSTTTTDAGISSATYTPDEVDFNTAITFRFTAEDPEATGPCGNTTYDVIVTVDEPAFVDITSIAGSNCQNENITLEGTYSGSATSAIWSIEPTAIGGYLGEGNITGYTDDGFGNVSAVYEPAANDAGENVTLRLTSTDPGTTCGIVSEDIIYSIDNPPTATITSSVTEVCEDNTVELKGTIGGGATSGTWRIKTGENTSAGTLSSTNFVSGEYIATYEPNSSYYGTIIFEFVAETTNSCQEAIEEISVEIFELPKATMTGPSNSCGTDVISLRADFEGTTALGNWVLETGNGTVNNINTTGTYSTVDYTPVAGDYNTTITLKFRALTAGAPNPCPEKFYPIDVFIDTPPTAVAGTGGNECDLDFQLGATPSVGTGTWSKVSGAGNISFNTTANDPDAIITVDAFGTYVFRWTEDNNGCTDFDQITVNFYEQPVAVAGAGGNECDLDFQLGATPSVGTGTWTLENGPGAITSFSTSANDENAVVTVDAYGTYTFRWTEDNNGCTDFDEITVNF